MSKPWCWQKFVPLPAPVIASRCRRTTAANRSNLMISFLLTGDSRPSLWDGDRSKRVKDAIYPHGVWGTWWALLPLNGDPVETPDFLEAYWLDKFKNYFDGG